MAALDPAWLEELSELLRIPSVSADPAHQDDVRRAAEWVREFVRASGGDCELVEHGDRPLVIGELRASVDADSAATVLVYGHFDVQPPAPLEAWESPRSSRRSAASGCTRGGSPTTRASSTCC